jgi:hypothetical protein
MAKSSAAARTRPGDMTPLRCHAGPVRVARYTFRLIGSQAGTKKGASTRRSAHLAARVSRANGDRRGRHLDPGDRRQHEADDGRHSRGKGSEDSALFVSGAVASCQRSSASARSVASIGSGSW